MIRDGQLFIFFNQVLHKKEFGFEDSGMVFGVLLPEGGVVVDKPSHLLPLRQSL